MNVLKALIIVIAVQLAKTLMEVSSALVAQCII